MKKIKQRTTVLFLKNVPANIKAQFKAVCAKREISMTQAIVNYMEQTVKITTKGTGLKL